MANQSEGTGDKSGAEDASAASRDRQPLLKTGEVLERSSISRQVLYRYMQLELVTPAETTDTGRNLFRESVFRQIELIQQLNQSGYTLRDIREIFSERLRKMHG